MINVNKGVCHIEGQNMDLLAELAAIVAGLKNAGLPEELILQTVAAGMVYSTKIQKEGLDRKKKMYDEVMKEIKRRKDAQKD